MREGDGLGAQGGAQGGEVEVGVEAALGFLAGDDVEELVLAGGGLDFGELVHGGREMGTMAPSG